MRLSCSMRRPGFSGTGDRQALQSWWSCPPSSRGQVTPIATCLKGCGGTQLEPPQAALVLSWVTFRGKRLQSRPADPKIPTPQALSSLSPAQLLSAAEDSFVRVWGLSRNADTDSIEVSPRTARLKGWETPVFPGPHWIPRPHLSLHLLAGEMGQGKAWFSPYSAGMCPPCPKPGWGVKAVRMPAKGLWAWGATLAVVRCLGASGQAPSSQAPPCFPARWLSCGGGQECLKGTHQFLCSWNIATRSV